MLAYRAVALWLPAPAGAAAIVGLRRRAASWSPGDVPAAVPA